MVLSPVQGEFHLQIFGLEDFEEPRLLVELGNHLEETSFEILKGVCKNCEKSPAGDTPKRGPTFPSRRLCLGAMDGKKVKEKWNCTS